MRVRDGRADDGKQESNDCDSRQPIRHDVVRLYWVKKNAVGTFAHARGAAAAFFAHPDTLRYGARRR
jgi:hypothetical protein